MNSIAFIYLNTFAILVLALTLRNYRQKFRYICCEEKVFIVFILSTIAVLGIEAALDNLWGVPGQGVHVLLHILQAADFTLTIGIPMLWLYYCLLRIYKMDKLSRRTRALIALPAVIYVILLLATIPGDIAFSINADNLYKRGIAFFVSFIVGYLYIAAALLLIILKRKVLNRGELVPYLLVPFIPITLGIIEVLTKSIFGLAWAATSLVILEIQMFVLNKKTNIDHLTGLNNRMTLDDYVRRTIHESQSEGKALGLIMIDVDDFKLINDRYGHVEGDRALKITADILRECFIGQHFIARYGGDEFTVVLKGCTQRILDRYLAKLEAERVKQNKAVSKPYEIHFSIGASVFSESEITDVHTMLMQVDQMMYDDKFARKGQDARS